MRHLLLLSLLFSLNCFSQSQFHVLLDFYLKSHTNVQVVSWVYVIDEDANQLKLTDSLLYDISLFDKKGHLKTYKYNFLGNDTSKYDILTFDERLDSLASKRYKHSFKTETHYWTPQYEAFSLPALKIKCKYNNIFLVSRTTTHWHPERKRYRSKEYFYYNKDETLREVEILEEGKMRTYYKFFYIYDK